MAHPTKPYQLCNLIHDPQYPDSEIKDHRLVQTTSMPFPASAEEMNKLIGKRVQLTVKDDRIKSVAFEKPVGILIKVRLVPGDPESLSELPIENLQINSEFKSSELFIHYARASGVFGFPLDMLRRDHCFFTDPEYNSNNGGPITIYKISNQKTPGWNYERWRSFSWNINPQITQRLDWSK